MKDDFKVLDQYNGEGFTIYNADCVEFAQQIPDDSLGFTVYSPPFSSLFVYSDSERDMGNSDDDDQFFEHYKFLIRELFRATKPGRLSAVHCSDLPLTKWKDGRVGIKDLSGMIVRAHEECGWTLHSKITIWKCPVVEMTRTKALGLLYKQVCKDSGRSRAGMPDYLLVFRKEGENDAPISHKPQDLPVDTWQKWASPVWMDIQQTNTLNVKIARDDKDEKHLCPLQLDLIERALVMWSAPGDVVYSPFTGVGSEGYMSVKLGRKFIGTELKPSYFKQACQYIEHASRETTDLFSSIEQ